ncbi:hypothetical protein [Enterovibrio calviensis]|uniref:hypothetical protein n=1 Tax=Enterovibrio calviensis TaxID=91359 RepID=UPI0037361066
MPYIKTGFITLHRVQRLVASSAVLNVNMVVVISFDRPLAAPHPPHTHRYSAIECAANNNGMVTERGLADGVWGFMEAV